MGKVKEYKCNGCGYTIIGTKTGRTLGMMGEIETEKVPKKCPKCEGDMKGTGKAFLIDQRPDRVCYVSERIKGSHRCEPLMPNLKLCMKNH